MNVFLSIKTARKAFIKGKTTVCCYKLHSKKLEKNTSNVGGCSILIKVTGGCLACITTFMFPVAQRYLHAKPKRERDWPQSRKAGGDIVPRHRPGSLPYDGVTLSQPFCL